MSLYSSDIRITAKFSPNDFTPDGDLDKPVWHEADWVHFDHDMSGRRHYPQAETEVAAAWTSTSIYFAYRCKYTGLNVYENEDASRERWELWERDVVEAFINPTPEHVNHYYEFEVAPNNQWLDLEIDKDKTPFNDASWNSGFEHSTRIDAKRHVWTCEMRISLASLGVTRLAPGTEWRINLFRADGRGSPAERRLMAWSTIPEGHTFHVPSRFGILEFAR
jgi:Carbohydrate family 9 binding domain-like